MQNISACVIILMLGFCFFYFFFFNNTFNKTQKNKLYQNLTNSFLPIFLFILFKLIITTTLLHYDTDGNVFYPINYHNYPFSITTLQHYYKTVVIGVIVIQI